MNWGRGYLMKPAIRVENLSKQYRLTAGAGAHGNLAEAVTRSAAGVARRLMGRRGNGRPDAADFWALRDVSFEVEPGQVLGIIGRNGAGKSTLLKILSRIVEPTSGRAELRGRLGSLLEVGTGFHPELSGRENVYLNGSMLGMARREITRKFDDIVAFAEIDEFLDTPVKRYSSGMYVRLAFAVAAHLEPEILVVDEVLAVGDQQFQDRCLGKMRDVSRAGRTILFVSHNMTAVRNMCGRAIVLDGGRMVHDGPPAEAIRVYLRESAGLCPEWRDDRTPNPNDALRFTAVRVRSDDGEVTGTLDPAQPFTIEFDYTVSRSMVCQIAFRLNQADGLTVLTTGDGDRDWIFARRREPGRYRAAVEIPGHLLAPGRYHLLVAANSPRQPAADLLESVLAFEVGTVGSLKQMEGRLGVVLPVLPWTEHVVGEGG